MGKFATFPNRHWFGLFRERAAARRQRARDDREAAEYQERQRDAQDAAKLGPIVLLGQGDYQTTPFNSARLSMPQPKRHGPTVTRKVLLTDIEVEIEIEVEEEHHDGHTGPRGHVDLSAGRVWLSNPTAAMKALEEAAYEAGQDVEDLGGAE